VYAGTVLDGRASVGELGGGGLEVPPALLITVSSIKM